MEDNFVNSKEWKEMQHEIDYYAHEYFSECDLSEKLQENIDKAIEVLKNALEEHGPDEDIEEALVLLSEKL